MTPARRRFVFATAAGLFLRHAFAQPKVPVLGVLVTDIRRNTSVPILIQGLRDEGYVEGDNLAFRIRSGDGSAAELPKLARELARENVNVVYATGPAAVKAMRDASASIPIVALDLETDPVAAGWATSLAHPAGNVTGLFLNLPEFAGKLVQLIREANPGSRRVGLVWDSSVGTSQFDAARGAASRLGVELVAREIRTEADLASAIAAVADARVSSVVFLSSPTVSQASARIAELVNRHRLSALTPFRAFAAAGGLISYGPRFDDFRGRAALFVVKILKGAKPGDLPIEQPTTFELVVNLRTAKALGIAIPQALLLRADEVIQ
ncbi:MAG: ABC transporter substrate-binding protein [Burkholderiales bacterium]|nr:ABC transporter substrate-binding protein [Burkholderiales bacterium]